MSSYHPQHHAHRPHAAHGHRQPAQYNAAPMPHSAPAGTFMPGTKVQVGNHRVVIEKYLSEGGFAHVYVVRLPQAVDGTDVAVLKRVAVPDKAALANMRTEVETMKKLKGHKHIVKYIDSHASQLQGGGYEVFLLMEFCSGGGLIDFMNTRLQNRLTEPEILKIFTDVAEGVACMHYLKPPLLHRDLKVENVLISLSGSSVCYKLCDFGSAAPPRPAATSAAEGRLIEDDVQRHTTLQYRSPEMIDVYRKQPIDEKSDIWALGVLLYKLCYYTTPFEEVGQMAILNASYKFPAYPPFSDRLKMLIASMLRENPQKRPNIYEVLKEACNMSGREVPIRDIYAGRSVSEARRYQELPPSPTEAPKVGAVFSPPVQETQIIPEIAPMRRGRPAKPTSQHNSAKPSPSPAAPRAVSHDPFAALDGGKSKDPVDEISARFPTLDQFSLLHEKGGKFDFEPTVVETKPDPDDLSQRVTNALADEVFAKHGTPPMPPREPSANAQALSAAAERRPKESPRLGGETPARQTPLYQPSPQKPGMVSTGTMTSPSPPLTSTSDFKPPSARPVYRFPPSSHERRPSSQPWTSEGRSPTGQGAVPSQTTTIHKIEPKHKPSSERISNLPVSSRPSLETSRPSHLDIDDPVSRSKSANSKARPQSVLVPSRHENLVDLGSGRASMDSPRTPYDDGAPLQHAYTSVEHRDYDRSNISSDVDYLRAREEEENSRKRDKRMSSGSKHTKRSSLTSLSLAGTKSLLAGRFGEAFRRFEQNAPEQGQAQGSRTPSPDEPSTRLAPVAAPEAADLNDEAVADNEDDISPEMRRELERRRLSQEEKRVANAAAEYRRRLAEKGDGGRRPEGAAPSIQDKVQSLLQENNKPTPPKTASGYGRYTDADDALQAKQFESRSEPQSTPRPLSRNPGPVYNEFDKPKLPTRPKDVSGAPGGLPKQQTASGAFASVQRTGPRPAAPPKPKNLQITGKSESSAASGNDRGPSTQDTPVSAVTDDWEESFSRRYPSLSGLEMVETEIDIPRLPSIRTREV
ncbi:serine/threonine protein kinase [Paecilomyces variotii No. 5]|uniref:non-specific serine/threonine protein kinase n=1 Tax=Byssochlamys spectabilis (strain No. 5 / NBRC 109023) TaxID=1356009 RepID=V5FZ24_BYSSN|nr:serine/threonine protein kinase [Paecilomyces variotii No. 5]